MTRSRHRATRLACVILALFLLTSVLPSAVPVPDGQGVALLRNAAGRDISGHGSSGIVGAWLEKEIAVAVTGEDGRSVAGATVHFVLVRQPDKAKGASVEPSVALTDSDGIATARLRLGSKPGDYVITATTPDMPGRPATVAVEAKSAAWLVFLMFTLFGGLAVFLYGQDFRFWVTVTDVPGIVRAWIEQESARTSTRSTCCRRSTTSRAVIWPRSWVAAMTP